ncbi:hypothetical protein [Sphingomonas sp. ID0503]|uniref:hypothetical protein n=1 Tax=Sphingomonas sp. ID0503 TaxID=3399691 RepID=UPI003AFB3706
MIATETATRLPDGFEELEPFVGKWAAENTERRIQIRSESTMEDIQAFYDAMTERAAEAMNHVAKFPLHDLPPQEATLSKLLLALASAATAIEIHGQPVAPGAVYPNSIRLVRGTAPFG